MPIDYNYPLHEARPIQDLRDMLRQSQELFSAKALFKVKEPRVINEPVKFDRRGLPRRLKEYVNISYRRFYEDVRSLGAWALAHAGSGRRVAIIGASRYEWYLSYMTTVCGLGVVIPLDQELPEAEVKSLLARSYADTIVYAGDKADLIAKIRGDLPDLKHFIAMDEKKSGPEDICFWHILAENHRLTAADRQAYDDLPIDPMALAVLLFTSGTTSRAKAVMLSHHNLASNLMQMVQMVDVEDKDIFLSVLPLHHTYECTCGFLCPVYLGATIAVCEGLRYINSNMVEAQASVMLVVPLMLEAFHRRILKAASASIKQKYAFDLALKISEVLLKFGVDKRKTFFQQIHNNFGGNMRLLITGGAPIEADIIKDMQALGFTCIQGYGLTECSPLMAVNRDYYSLPEAAGLPVPKMEVKLINQDENGIGEVVCKGPSVMLGYYEEPDKTAEAIDKEGYFHSGDYGYINDQGFIVLTGRKSNIIVTSNGKNIFPEELEYLLSQYGLVKEVIVAAKETDNGKVLVAYIYPDMEFAANVPELEGKALESEEIRSALEDIIKAVNAKLVNYKHIKDIEVRAQEFEKTTTKKIKRRLI